MGGHAVFNTVSLAAGSVSNSDSYCHREHSLDIVWGHGTSHLLNTGLSTRQTSFHTHLQSVLLNQKVWMSTSEPAETQPPQRTWILTQQEIKPRTSFLWGNNSNHLNTESCWIKTNKIKWMRPNRPTTCEIDYTGFCLRIIQKELKEHFNQ